MVMKGKSSPRLVEYSVDGDPQCYEISGLTVGTAFLLLATATFAAAVRQSGTSVPGSIADVGPVVGSVRVRHRPQLGMYGAAVDERWIPIIASGLHPRDGMNQRTPSASTAEFFNTIGAKRTLAKKLTEARC